MVIIINLQLFLYNHIISIGQCENILGVLIDDII